MVVRGFRVAPSTTLAWVAGACMTLAPGSALAEVMDKEPSLPALWAFVVLVNLLALVLARLKWWFPILVWPVGMIGAVAIMGELRDPYVGPVILAEAGWLQVTQAYLAAAASALGPLSIFIWGLSIVRRDKGD